MAKILKSNRPANAKTRRLAKQNEYWDRKRAEYEAKPISRSVEEIWDSIIRPVDETDVLANLVIGLNKDIKDDGNSGSCCMSEVALYSTKHYSKKLAVTARV
ncbi:hypothetical protein Xbed_03467 [Xenorhabdus beddingii]|uniref:Uncharacterized protein n=1 Tax=Xenorhabdus beddingii TaxID=40578 RepID=A0A1Y2SCS4_9GAMM|nr:hypothetical protein [Xenorhabdus beddingii]OTA16540.1 hypothetical protein Xbed_03467 [Xenorhabdus beddingii]